MKYTQIFPLYAMDRMRDGVLAPAISRKIAIVSFPVFSVPAEVERFFSDQSPLASEVASFRPRPQQRDMALAVAEAIRDNAILVAEAGTGTGKTFAYLVPALLAGGKVVISTGTKNLQDQLFQKDLPMVRDALKAPVTVALLKGRANYVCHYHLERAQSNGASRRARM